MIKVSRLNGKELFVNADLIESVEETPDTVISMTTGKKVIVVDSAEEVLEKVVAYKRRIMSVEND